ncbi:MAG TPA: ABC transporter permease [Clostridiales bacterium]|nr:ABC transporter permease [Clostridiales bacterium]
MRYLFKKAIIFIITLLIISVLTFTAFQVIPGNSALTALGMEATDEAIETLKEELGFNKNVFIRYFDWLKKVTKGDFGDSIQYHSKATDLIKDRVVVTLWLAIISFILILIIALPLGVLSALKKNSIVDKAILVMTQISMAIPPFFLGILLTILFGFVIKIFIPGNYISYKEDIAGFLYYLIFPAMAVAIPKISMLVKFLRNSIIRELKLDYVRTARSKGNDERTIMYKHVLKNAFIPIITLLGMMLADIMAGTILIEQVFSLPGLGRLLLVSISNRDFAVVQAIILYMALIVVLINFIVDILYQFLDPRVTKI